MVDGFLVVDKPSGITSHDVVARVRRATGIKKAGHAGTLDPLATGAVVVALGRATRLIRFVQDFDKEYLATAMFGVATDSLDSDGNQIERTPMPVSHDEVVAASKRLIGDIEQVPPMVSALKVDGRRLYELAREGKEVERQPRRVVVHEFEVLSVGAGPHPLVDFRVVCGKGTYVRVLADDLAQSLGGRAHLTALRRTRIGGLAVASLGVSVGELEDRWREALVDPASALAALPSVEVDSEVAAGVLHGRPLPAGPLPVGTHFRVMGGGGRLLAVFRTDDDAARPEVVLG